MSCVAFKDDGKINQCCTDKHVFEEINWGELAHFGFCKCLRKKGQLSGVLLFVIARTATTYNDDLKHCNYGY